MGRLDCILISVAEPLPNMHRVLALICNTRPQFPILVNLNLTYLPHQPCEHHSFAYLLRF